MFSNWRCKVSILVLAVVTVFGVRENRAMGDLIITIQGGSIAPNGTAIFDVFIRSSTTGTDSFALANYEFAITAVNPTNNTSGKLQFASNQPNPSDKANYVFTNLAPGNPAVMRQGSGPEYLSAIGGDFTDPVLNLPLDVLNSDKLLTRLQLVHSTPTPGSAIGTYRISLVNSANTFFRLADLSTAVTIDALSYSEANSGLITITAVPEPSTVMLLSLAGAVGIGTWRIRRMRNRS